MRRNSYANANVETNTPAAHYICVVTISLISMRSILSQMEVNINDNPRDDDPQKNRADVSALSSWHFSLSLVADVQPCNHAS